VFGTRFYAPEISPGSFGTYPVPHNTGDAGRGGGSCIGVLFYFSADPGAEQDVRLKLTSSQMSGVNIIAGTGIPVMLENRFLFF